MAVRSGRGVAAARYAPIDLLPSFPLPFVSAVTGLGAPKYPELLKLVMSLP